jgi:signal peptidase I
VTTSHADPSGEETDHGTTDAARRPSHRLRETVVVVVIALVAAVLLRLFVVQSYYIPSASMEPTLRGGDHILVNKLSYEFHGVDRGNIVVFRRPPKELCGGTPVPDLVKRVVGLPGETISLTGRGRVVINGKVLHEAWLPASQQGMTYAGPAGTPYDLDRPYKIPSNHYFVMGDHRGDSCDSRYWGPISTSLIVGQVDVRIWPLDAFRFF